MVLSVFFTVLSGIALIMSFLVFFLYFTGVIKHRNDRAFQGAYIMGMVLFFLADFFVLIPLYLFREGLSPYRGVVTALISALQEFTLDLDAEDILRSANGNILMHVYLSIFMVISPLMTVGAVLSLIKDFFSGVRLFFAKSRSYKNMYVFSSLNEESVTLAESIREYEKDRLYDMHEFISSKYTLRRKLRHNVMIIFAGVDLSSKDGSDLFDRLNEIDAVVFKKDMLSLKIFRDLKGTLYSGRYRTRRWFFMMDRKTDNNISDTLSLSRKYREYMENRNGNGDLSAVADIKMFVFSSSPDSEYVFDSEVKENLRLTDCSEDDFKNGKIIRINELRSLVYNRLYNCGRYLFLSDKKDGENGGYLSKNHISVQQRISAAVIGAGGYGKEMIKALPWFCHMNRSSVHTDVFDKSIEALHRLKFDFPALFDNDKNGVTKGSYQSYAIEIHPPVDIFSEAFDEAFEKAAPKDYILVSLGSDEMNISASMHIRMLCERMNIHPLIEAIVYDTKRAEALEEFGLADMAKDNRLLRKYDIRFIGDIESCYSYDNVLMPSLYDHAKSCHDLWAESKERKDLFYISEYCKRSSMAAAIRQKSRKELGYDDRQIGDNNLSNAELDHIGWWEWMLSEGFIYNEKRNDLAKQHDLMIPYDELFDEDKDKDRRLTGDQQEK